MDCRNGPGTRAVRHYFGRVTGDPHVKCPSCDASLVEKHVVRMSIDFCNICQGIWFDPGELTEYQSILALTDAGEPDAEDQLMLTPNASIQNCPRCEATTLQTGSFSGYDMSQCRKCRGVFVPTATLHSFGFRPGTAFKWHAADV